MDLQSGPNISQELENHFKQYHVIYKCTLWKCDTLTLSVRTYHTYIKGELNAMICSEHDSLIKVFLASSCIWGKLESCFPLWIKDSVTIKTFKKDVGELLLESY